MNFLAGFIFGCLATYILGRMLRPPDPLLDVHSLIDACAAMGWLRVPA